MKSIGYVIVLLALGLGACSFSNPSSEREDRPATVVPGDRPLLASTPPTQPTSVATNTPVPTITPSPTITRDASPPSMLTRGGDQLCRFGPGLRYGIGGSLREGVQVVIRARNGAGDWFQFELPDYAGKYCWVAAKDVDASGDLSQLSIAEAPLSFVTNVTVLIDPLVLEPAICAFPLTFNVQFSIETIGPTFVTFQRSTSNGSSAPPETVEFSEAGSKAFEDYLRVDAAGEHWYKVSVTSPNSVVGQGIGLVICP